MAKKETPPKADEPPAPVTSRGVANPATDTTKTAQERLDALTEQHKAMHERQARGESPD